MTDAPGEPFLMGVEDVFRRHGGRSVLLTGLIERGRVRRGDEVEIVGFADTAPVTVRDVEVCHRSVDEAGAGMNVSLSVHGAAAGAAERGQVLAAPGSVGRHTRFAAAVTLLSEEDGGADIRTGARLLLHLRAAVLAGDVTLSRDTDLLRPLHGGDVTITLERPVALEDGQRFAFRHLGRAAGTGVVSLLPE